jgi:hypothetical protein
LKVSNAAKSVSEIIPQASLFIPTTLPSSPLPGYVQLDLNSQWQVAGLYSAALESMTLPSRLKPRNGIRQTLDQIAATLNANGNQNIAKLCMTVKQNSHGPVNGNNHPRTNGNSQDTDPRVSSRLMAMRDTGNGEENNDVARFDMEFFPTEVMEQSRGRRTSNKIHVFGQAENYRGDEDDKEEVDRNDEGQERARRVAASLPLLSRFVLLALCSSYYILHNVIEHIYPCHFLFWIASRGYLLRVSSQHLFLS